MKNIRENKKSSFKVYIIFAIIVAIHTIGVITSVYEDYGIYWLLAYVLPFYALGMFGYLLSKLIFKKNRPRLQKFVIVAAWITWVIPFFGILISGMLLKIGLKYREDNNTYDKYMSLFYASVLLAATRMTMDLDYYMQIFNS